MGDLWLMQVESTPMMGLNGTHENMDLENQSLDLSTIPLFVGYPTTLTYFASICCILFMMVGIPGNLITIAALARCKKVRNATAVFIMNLSCSDLLFCCFNLPLAASTFWARAWLHGQLLCRLFPLLRYGLLAVSIFTVLAITINRYVMIGHPTLYPKLYRHRLLGVMVSSTWISGFGALAATWMGAWGSFGLDQNIGSCSILPDEKNRSPKEFLFVIAFVVPCLAIIVCYARIFYIVRKTALQSRGNQKNNQKKSISTNCQNSNVTGSMENNIHLKPITKLPNKNCLLSPEDSVLGSVSTTTTTADKSLSFGADKLKTEKENNLYSETGMTKENGGSDLNSNNKNFKKKNVSHMLNFRMKKEKGDPNLLSPPDIYYKHNEKKPKKIIMEPSSSSGIDTYDDQENTSMRSNTPTSIESSPTNTSRRKSRSSRFHSIPSLTRMTSMIRRDGKKSKKNHQTVASNSNGYPGKMSSKDKKLLKMILVIFISFLVCYMPITINKIFKFMDFHVLNIAGYILIYLTTCINPIIYVVMSSEYRQAYKNLMMCKGFSQDQPRRA